MRHEANRRVIDYVKFQSTHPRGVRLTPPSLSAHRSVQFQSTHPRGVRRWSAGRSLSRSAISIHAPTWGATEQIRGRYVRLEISIHAPTWGATYNPNHVAPPEIFQSTHPRGVRHKAGDDVIKHRVFQSMHPRGVRLILSIQEWWARNFNPRTHVGCDIRLEMT